MEGAHVEDMELCVLLPNNNPTTLTATHHTPHIHFHIHIHTSTFFFFLTVFWQNRYGLASLCETFEIPIYAIKYVANACNDSAHEDCHQNVENMRTNAEQLLMTLLTEIKAL